MSKSIFYCDIEGTYRTSANEPPEIRKKELQNFANVLDILCEANNDDGIYFSFVSSNNMHDIIVCIKEFLPYIKNSKHIELGTSFSEKEKIIGENIDRILPHHSIGKSTQIVHNVEHVLYDDKYAHNADISRVYFADDTLIYHKMLIHVFKKKYKDIELVALMPGNKKGLEEAYAVEKEGLHGVIYSALKYAKEQDLLNSFKETDKKIDLFKYEK